MNISYDMRISRNFYYVCLGAYIILGIFYLVLNNILHISITDLNPYPCSLNSNYGLYCPGCGGTRAVDYLLHGQFILSTWYHPVVPYVAVYFNCYVISHSLNILTNGKCKAMAFRPVYFYVMIAIILIQWIVKNTIVIFAGIYVI